MSPASTFKTLVYYGSETITVLKSSAKGWKELGKFPKDGALPSAVQKALSDTVLVLVSDTYLGHLQLLLENSKSVLSDQNIAKILSDDYEIDTTVYEFASQKFTLSREQVQLSISGVEREIYDEIVRWLGGFAPEKTWIMPFGWFVSALKSVEPVLLAVALSETEILVSHHYLGVDDAREIALEDLVAYVKSRKTERKETHLMYVQADVALQEKIVTEIGETVATHVLSEPRKETVLATIADAVWEKGEEALSDLLHFEVTFDSPTPVAAVSADSPSDDEQDSQVGETETTSQENIVPAIADLPKPQPPAVADEPENMPENIEIVESMVIAPQEPAIPVAAPSAPAADEPATEQESHVEASAPQVVPAPKASVATVSVSEPLKVASPKVIPQVTESVPVSSPVEDSVLEPVEEAPTQAVSPSLADLSPSGVARASESRYRDVPKKTSWKLVFSVFFSVVILTSIIGGAIFWSQQTVETATPLLPSSSPSPTPLIAAEPAATDSADIANTGDQLTAEEKAELSVLVLNALGTAGLAGSTQDELEAAGWSDIAVGNATGSYDDAVFVYTKNEKVIETLKTDLDIDIKPASEISESGSSDYDVVFIIADEVPWQ